MAANAGMVAQWRSQEFSNGGAHFKDEKKILYDTYVISQVQHNYTKEFEIS